MYLLLTNGERLPKIQDCFVLAQKAKAPKETAEQADIVTPYYFRTRYPDSSFGKIEESEVQEVKRAAEEIFTWIKQH